MCGWRRPWDMPPGSSSFADARISARRDAVDDAGEVERERDRADNRAGHRIHADQLTSVGADRVQATAVRAQAELAELLTRDARADGERRGVDDEHRCPVLLRRVEIPAVGRHDGGPGK